MEKKRAIEEIAQLKGEIDKEEREQNEIRERIKNMKDAVDSGNLRSIREEVAALNRDFLSEERALQADLAVISHVLRKGEKVIGRTAGTSSAKDLEVLVDTLAGSGVPAEDQLIPGLSHSLPLIRSMIASGDITLKNKEEKELFSKETDLIARVRGGYARKEAAYQRFRAKERAYQETPLLTDLSAAQKEEERSAGHVEVMKTRLSGVSERNKALEDEIPELTAKVRAGVKALLGHSVSLTKQGVS
jgi:hypothetical protein